MSLRLVFGRSSTVASGWISCMYLGSMSMPTTAWPSSRSTEVTLPIWMPAMSTAWPCPGVTAWAVVNSAVMWSKLFADEGDPGRQRGFLLDEDAEHHHDAEHRQHRDRDRVLAAPAGLAGQRVAEVPEAAHLGFMPVHGLTAAGLGAPAWPMPALRSGTGLVSQRTSGFNGGRPPS